jgi:hypothetical protein
MGKGGQGKAKKKQKKERIAHLVARELPSIICKGHVPFPKPLRIFLGGNSFINMRAFLVLGHARAY